LKRRGWLTLVAALAVAGVVAAPTTAAAHRHRPHDLRVHQRNLVADRPGHAKLTD
jgi:hypothetical protein